MKISWIILCFVVLVGCHSMKSVVSSEQIDMRRLQTMAISLADTTFIIPGNIFCGIPCTSSPMGAHVPEIYPTAMNKQSLPAGVKPTMIVRHTQLTGKSRDDVQGDKESRHQVDKTEKTPDDSLITFLIIIVVILVMRLVFFRLNR